MPTINKRYSQPNRRRTDRTHISYNKRYDIQSNTSSKYYGTKQWHALRTLKLTNNPVCEICAHYGRSVPAEDVHHKRFFMSLPTPEERWFYFTDYNNLMSVCSKCHHMLHTYAKRHNQSYADMIPKDMYYSKHKYII